MQLRGCLWSAPGATKGNLFEARPRGCMKAMGVCWTRRSGTTVPLSTPLSRLRDAGRRLGPSVSRSSPVCVHWPWMTAVSMRPGCGNMNPDVTNSTEGFHERIGLFGRMASRFPQVAIWYLVAGQQDTGVRHYLTAYPPLRTVLSAIPPATA